MMLGVDFLIVLLGSVLICVDVLISNEQIQNTLYNFVRDKS